MDPLLSTLSENVFPQLVRKAFPEGYNLSFLPPVVMSFLLAVLLIPGLIFIAEAFELLDKPDNGRKKHLCPVPRIGGLAIAVSFIVAGVLVPELVTNSDQRIFYWGCAMVAGLGLKDDILDAKPRQKLFVQSLAASFVILLADVRISTLGGFLGIYELPFALSAGISLLIIVFVTNAFNLIDGIDGLAALTALLVNSTFGLLFISIHQATLATIAFTAAASSLGFLLYNLTPARIYMGDGGALLLGFISAIFSIEFLQLSGNRGPTIFSIVSAPAVCIAILIVPVFDACRVIILRIANRSSPFLADSSHLHHVLVSLGMTHLQSAGVLVMFNLLVMALAMGLSKGGEGRFVAELVFTCFLIHFLLSWLVSRRKSSCRTSRRHKPRDSPVARPTSKM